MSDIPTVTYYAYDGTRYVGQFSGEDSAVLAFIAAKGYTTGPKPLASDRDLWVSIVSQATAAAEAAEAARDSVKGWTGGSYNASTGIVTFTSDDGLGFVTGDLRGSDGTGWTGGSYDESTGVVTFTSDDGLGFSTGDLRGANGEGTGTVTSIDITGGTGITSTGGPVTSSGAITVALDSATQTSLALADSAQQPPAEGAFVDGDKTKLDGIETGADVTDTANVTAAGALMDSELTSLSGVKTLTVPDSTTISTFGASLVDDADAATARTTLGLGTGATATIADYAPLASPALTGTPTAPTPTAGDNSTKLATTAYVDAAAGGGGFEFIATADASAAAAVEFTAFDATKYDAYCFIFSNLAPSVDDRNLAIRTSTDGGATYDNGVTDYAYNLISEATVFSSAGISAFFLSDPATNKVGNAANEDISGVLYVLAPHLAKHTRFVFNSFWADAGGAPRTAQGGGARLSAADVDGIQFKFQSGNIASGTVTMYGMKNA